jgi:hypothetical protein
MYKEKYIKYKTKYTALKNQFGGDGFNYSDNEDYLSISTLEHQFYMLTIHYKQKKIWFEIPDDAMSESENIDNLESHKYYIWSADNPTKYDKVFLTNIPKMKIMRPFFVKAEEFIRTYLQNLPASSQRGKSPDEVQEELKTKGMFLEVLQTLSRDYDHT